MTGVAVHRSAIALGNQRLVGRIKALHEASDGVLGSPRITEDLRYEGESCCQNRVARLMRLEGLQGVPVNKAANGQAVRYPAERNPESSGA